MLDGCPTWICLEMSNDRKGWMELWSRQQKTGISEVKATKENKEKRWEKISDIKYQQLETTKRQKFKRLQKNKEKSGK